MNKNISNSLNSILVDKAKNQIKNILFDQGGTLRLST